MKFSVIVPSYNQDKYIGATLNNLRQLKELAKQLQVEVEVLLFDSESNEGVQKEIEKYRDVIDVLEVKKDKGQYDAINKGLEVCKGTYWTWLNTDDHIDPDGFFKLAERLKSDSTIDYIYGGIHYMDTNDKVLSLVKAKQLTLKELVNRVPGIYQPGSFFKKSFTDKIGFLKPYRCCFDYEYILRCLSFNGKFVCCEFPVSRFRYYSDSKTGSLIPVFIREQLEISSDYGRSFFSFLTWFSYLRLLKHKLFQR